MSFTKTKIRDAAASQYESSANTDSLTGSQYENCAALHNMRVRQHVREQILPGAGPVGGISIGSFVRGAGCGSPTGVTAHSSSATAGANQDHRAGANQDHNPERLWRQRGVVGAAPQERDGGASFEMRDVSGSRVLLLPNY